MKNVLDFSDADTGKSSLIQVKVNVDSTTMIQWGARDILGMPRVVSKM